MAAIMQLRRIASNVEKMDFERSSSEDDLPEREVLTVDVDPAELELNPRSWPLHKRVWYTFLVTMVGWVVTWAASVVSPVGQAAAAEFGVSETVESLATGLYFIGFGLGSLVAGPVSETLGRNVIYTLALLLFMAFIAASGAAPNIQSQLVFRFLAGFFGNTPLTCAGGSLADLWSPEERVLVVPFYAVGIFDGSTLAPVVGGWIAQGAAAGKLSWRWAEWTTLLGSALLLIGIAVSLPETCTPVLLQWKARQIRVRTGDKRYHAPAELDRQPFLKRLGQALHRPFTFLAHEPIVIAIALYLILIYVVLFTFLNGFPSIFGPEGTYGWSHGLSGTAFMSIFVGQHLPLVTMPLTRRWAAIYRAKLQRDGAQEIDPPENRLWMAMIGAVALPISLFWLGWTATSSISPWSCLGAGVLFGFACVAIYISFYMFVVDAYAAAAASGLASTTVLRYVVSGAMVPPSIPMYARLGNNWTLTIFGSLSVILGIVPFIFFWYGAALRRRSPFARQQA